ncbi:hypothetical protein AR9_g005 [Bacillus phage AR9]|uniref:Uncharacterized protein n=2 Tax=Bacillus phage PBS1 TaxID=10683 RepID=A0A172JHR5_BPPB1|nr:hypothetical protein BI022_gp005 [Bacillus phage AR9]YP_009664391.1 hypothetical protein FK780_gp257 [Bacillus phage PBS1]PTU25852.1 hypothetical protein DA469_21595 [Bacillus subtilis]QXN70219.1 hypothetical protein INTERNEXUS_179 [Bacillus phage vB_BspM_Internexus]WCS68115.1 hypothetical protein Goe21_00050 [Bacillus phage vB_BsuM-Goe21]AMS01090.1 hypothetical protein AR9_g005 [Bacillus phage AR9]ASU00012.1 hypothetical protein PBI_PBS1_190 [Bacillus phage PBS1]
MDTKIIDKIKKALALANDAPNDEEAQAAMLAVQRLMVKHNISMKDVELKDNSEKKVVQDDKVIEPTGRISWWKKQLSAIIAKNFKCEALISKYAKNKSSITFLGLEEDVIIAKSVFQYAEKVIDKFAKSYVGKVYRSGKSTVGVRNIFINGFLVGLNEKFEEQKNENNWGLVLVKDSLVVQTLEKMNLRKHSSSGIKPKFANDSEAWEAGNKKGKSFADTQKRKGIESNE